MMGEKSEKPSLPLGRGSEIDREGALRHWGDGNVQQIDLFGLHRCLHLAELRAVQCM